MTRLTGQGRVPGQSLQQNRRYFQATIKTSGSKAGHTYPLTVTGKATDSTIVATTTEQVTAK